MREQIPNSIIARQSFLFVLLKNQIFTDIIKDTKERKYIVPTYIEKARKDNGVLEQYLKQSDYLKREQVNYIEIAKKGRNKEKQD